MVTKYKIQDKQTGTLIESNLTLDEAEKTLAKFEQDDKDNGTFEQDFYEVVEDKEE